MSALDEVTLDLDEFEAIRLADLEGMYQQQAAETMSVSRQTFARVIEIARRKVADALVHGKALRIEGLDPAANGRDFHCPRCREVWIHAAPGEHPEACPKCGTAADGKGRQDG
jgi:predicted DNA-binding protein (UPF0251 family)